MQPSGPKTPCKVCGRDSDGDCRSTEDLILCHQGRRFAPPAHLRPGDTLSIDGKPWALIRHGGGFDGQAAVFRPHRESSPPANRHPDGGNARAKARQAVAAFAIERFYRAFQAAWDVPDFHSLTPEALREAIRTIELAHEIGRALAASLQRLWRDAPDLKVIHRERINGYLKSLNYQLDDLRHFRSCYLGEVQL